MAARRALLLLGSPRTYRPEEAILLEGDRTRHVVPILSGWTKVSAVTEHGRKALLGIRVAGDIVGELAALDGWPRSATVSACGPVTAREISRDEFHEFLARWPAAAVVVATTVAARLRIANRRRVEMSGLNVRDRLVRVLADLSHDYGRDTEHGREIGLELPQTDLAAAVGCGEASVHHALRQLREEGVIATRYRMVVILRPDALEFGT